MKVLPHGESAHDVHEPIDLRGRVADARRGRRATRAQTPPDEAGQIERVQRIRGGATVAAGKDDEERREPEGRVADESLGLVVGCRATWRGVGVRWWG